MKKGLVVLIVAMCVALLAAPAMAKQMNTGCGVGTLIFPQADSLAMQLVVTCTNGTFSNQTFGITFGTANCEKATTVVSNEVQEFVAGNIDNLAQDIATGQGESLDTLAELMGVKAEKRATFSSTLKENFAAIFTSPDVTAAQVIDNIVKVAINA